MKRFSKLLILLCLSTGVVSCSFDSSKESSKTEEPKQQDPTPVNPPSGDPSQGDPTPSNPPAPTYVENELSISSGLKVKFNAKGAKINSIYMDDNKIAENGFVAGRVANRIANGSFTLDGVTYTLNKNNGQHTLHGGSKGFGECTWTKTFQDDKSIVFELDSPDKDQGFPGNMHVSTTYTLSSLGELSIEYRATSDKKTIFNPTNHLYMNMNGISTNSYKNHTLWVDSTTYTKTNSSLIPTGEIVSTSGTTLDYSVSKTYVGNNDSNLVLNGTGYRKVAELKGNLINYKVEVFTDRPGLQVYNDTGHICLESQMYPDAIHHENFPSIVLEANEEYYSKTTYQFSKVSE